MLMHCARCGERIMDAAVFCKKCGMQLPNGEMTITVGRILSPLRSIVGKLKITPTTLSFTPSDGVNAMFNLMVNRHDVDTTCMEMPYHKIVRVYRWRYMMDPVIVLVLEDGSSLNYRVPLISLGKIDQFITLFERNKLILEKNA